MKSGVNELVRRQRDLCNRFASEARRVLEKSVDQEGAKKDKKELQAEDEAFKKLWLVSKGTPHNRVLHHLKENPDIRVALDKMDLYYYSDQNKDERTKALAELFIIIDERSSEYELTDKGIHAWHECTGGSLEDFVMMDISHEYNLVDENHELDAAAKMQAKLAVQEEDIKRKERAHNLRQLLRAHLLMERDVDYMVDQDKIVIIDENTGRPQPGRRFSDGLHQAIEAKESVSIQKETQTYATITLQNYFRMYEKVAGMTGTASTEANEFKQIYNIDVLEIPTYRPCKRVEHNDEIYMSEREKYNAILKEVREIHAAGRPILIGTESVEVSEKLARIFKANRLEHTVLNAKNHASEAEIIAHAGRRGAITIATNMAGRGTDIKLDKGVADIGGLYVMGTARHQSRRIDRQLRGRCARLGDPGSAKFYVSFEDSLLRLFASPRMTAIIQRFRPPEGEPISAGILNKSIETAQKRIEQRNYVIRKHTLEYDDVMNKQRKEIYAFRNDVLHSEDIEPVAVDLLESVCFFAADQFFRSRSEEGGWDAEGYRQWLMHHFPITFEEGYFDLDYKDSQELAQMAAEKVVEAFKTKLDRENSKVPSRPQEANGLLFMPRKPANEAVRNLIIRKTDQLWQEHLLVMDHLRTDVNLRTVGQKDPLMEFKHEAFTLFDELNRKLKTEIGQDLFRFEIVVRPPPTIEQMMSLIKLETNRSLVSDLDQTTQTQARQESAPQQAPEPTHPVVVGPRTGRNDPCPCGSGKKYKKCCGASHDDGEE